MSEIDLIDMILKNALELQRLSAHEANEAEALLRELEAELRQMLNSRTLSDASKREIAALIKQAEKAISAKYVTVGSTLDTHGLIVLVSERTVEAMQSLGAIRPTAETLASLAKNVLIEGAPTADWWERQAEDTAFKFAAQVRQGVINGETNERIVARITGNNLEPGILGVARRNARALVHSSVMSAANDARLATYRKNSRLIAGVRWVSALDGHVCWTAETLVTMADGSQRQIAEIREGDMVTGGVTGDPCRVVFAAKRLVPSTVAIHKNGHVIGHVTEDHPILTPTGWREAGRVALSADVSEREVLCRRVEASERPVSGASQASECALASRALPSMAKARRADDDDHRQGYELRDGLRDGEGADRAAEYQGSERLQHDGWRGCSGRPGADAGMEREGGSAQSTALGRSGCEGSREAVGYDTLERPGISRQDQRSAGSQASRVAQRSGLEGEASGKVRGSDAPQMARPDLSGEDGRAESASAFTGIAGEGEREPHSEYVSGSSLCDGAEVVGHPEGVTVEVVTGTLSDEPAEVYTLTIEGDPTYIAGGIIVHNCARCAALDGQAWDLDGNKLPGTEVEFQAPPIHWNDRCVLSPVPKAFRDMGIDIDEPTDAGQRASSLGPVSGSTTFQQFFGRLSRAQQDAMFGRTRAQMMRDGKITVRDLVNGKGRELSLAELQP